ncbi:glycosyltransferase [Candidatus Margulisiibacteriota bacterium]
MKARSLILGSMLNCLKRALSIRSYTICNFVPKMSDKVAQFTSRFLDISETFIYEPLRLMQKFHPTILCFQKRNKDKFPYDPIFSLDDLEQQAQSREKFLGVFGREAFFSQTIKEKKIEILHAHYGFNGIYALQFKKMNPKLKIIVNFYGLDVYQHTKNPVYRWQLKKLFKQGVLFLACSERMRNDLIKLGAPDERTIVHYGGANLKENLFSRPRQGDEIVFLMCGRFVEKKGFKYGIKAFLRSCRKNTKIRLKVIGSGPLEAELKQIVTKSEFGSKVDFLGALRHESYLREIEQAQIFISPSVTAGSGDKEGLPTVLIESAAIGRPLIASIHSGIPEIVHDQKNGILVAERDIEGLSAAINRMSNEKQLWNIYAEYGRKLAESRFDLIKQTAKIEELYQNMLEV